MIINALLKNSFYNQELVKIYFIKKNDFEKLNKAMRNWELTQNGL